MTSAGLRQFGVAVAATLALACAGLAAAATASAQPDAIAVERAAVEAKFERRGRECADPAAPAGCRQAVRRERRAALAPLLQHQAEREAAQRRQRAAERDASHAARVAEVKPPPSIRAPKPTAAGARTRPDREAAEARSRAAFEARQQAAARHREAVALRSSRVAGSASTPKSAPLPLPASAASR